MDMVNRTLMVKKGLPAADRINRFIGAFAKFLNEKGVLVRLATGAPTLIIPRLESQPETKRDEDDETPASRFMERLLRHLLKGFPAKNKNVRFRCLSITAEMVGFLGEIK